MNLLERLEELAKEWENGDVIAVDHYFEGKNDQRQYCAKAIRALIASSTEELQPSDEVIARTLERVEKQFSATHPEELAGLREAYLEYIALLEAELEDVIGLAYVHGWRSNRYEKGKELRSKIAALGKDKGKATP